MMRVEVETDLKLPIPPPMLSMPSRPPKDEEKVEKSTDVGQTIRRRKQKRREELDSSTCIITKSQFVQMWNLWIMLSNIKTQLPCISVAYSPLAPKASHSRIVWIAKTDPHYNIMQLFSWRCFWNCGHNMRRRVEFDSCSTGDCFSMRLFTSCCRKGKEPTGSEARVRASKRRKVIWIGRRRQTRMIIYIVSNSLRSWT